MSIARLNISSRFSYASKNPSHQYKFTMNISLIVISRLLDNLLTKTLLVYLVVEKQECKYWYNRKRQSWMKQKTQCVPPNVVWCQTVLGYIVNHPSLIAVADLNFEMISDIIQAIVVAKCFL